MRAASHAAWWMLSSVRAENAADFEETYRELVDDVHADIVTFQVASLDQEATIRLIGTEVLPRLRD